MVRCVGGVMDGQNVTADLPGAYMAVPVMLESFRQFTMEDLSPFGRDPIVYTQEYRRYWDGVKQVWMLTRERMPRDTMTWPAFTPFPRLARWLK